MSVVERVIWLEMSMARGMFELSWSSLSLKAGAVAAMENYIYIAAAVASYASDGSSWTCYKRSYRRTRVAAFRPFSLRRWNLHIMVPFA